MIELCILYPQHVHVYLLDGDGAAAALPSAQASPPKEAVGLTFFVHWCAFFRTPSPIPNGPRRGFVMPGAVCLQSIASRAAAGLAASPADAAAHAVSARRRTLLAVVPHHVAAASLYAPPLDGPSSTGPPLLPEEDLDRRGREDVVGNGDAPRLDLAVQFDDGRVQRVAVGVPLDEHVPGLAEAMGVGGGRGIIGRDGEASRSRSATSRLRDRGRRAGQMQMLGWAVLSIDERRTWPSLWMRPAACTSIMGSRHGSIR